MTFLANEQSIEDGRPVLLYKFVGGDATWRYTSGDIDVAWDGWVWKTAAISDDGVKQTGETINDAMTIECPSWIGPAQVFMSAAPSKNIQVTIYAQHEGDADTVAIYLGEITQVNFPMPGRARITAETLASSMQREGLRIGWQRSCPYVIYDPLTCKVDKAAWGITFIVLDIDGFNVQVGLSTRKASGYFNGGFIQWSHPTRGTENVAVDASIDGIVGTAADGAPNGTLQLLNDPGDLYVGASGTVYPSCSNTPTGCQSFSNYDNYGGFSGLPGKSPFDGTPVF